MGDQLPVLKGSRVYLDTPYILIRWDGDGPWVYVKWKGWANSPEYRAAQEVVIVALRENHASRNLIDSKESRVVADEDQEWLSKTGCLERWRLDVAGRRLSCPGARLAGRLRRTSTSTRGRNARGRALRNCRGRGRLALNRKLSFPDAPADRVLADVAQLAEQPPRKWQVVSSNLTVGSIKMPVWLMTNLPT
jgi:hypothetical protein